MRKRKQRCDIADALIAELEATPARDAFIEAQAAMIERLENEIALLRARASR